MDTPLADVDVHMVHMVHGLLWRVMGCVGERNVDINGDEPHVWHLF